MQSEKWQNDLCSFPRQTIQYHSNPSLCPDQQCWRSWSWIVLWRPTRPSITNTQKRCPFNYKRLEGKSRKSRNSWSNRQIWPWNTEWSRAKTNRVLPRERTGHSKHPLLTTQEKTLHMDITRWSTLKSDWLYSLQPKMEKLYSQQKQDQELTVAQKGEASAYNVGDPGLIPGSEGSSGEGNCNPLQYSCLENPMDGEVW